VATEFELQGLLNAGESRIAELDRRSREPAGLGLQRAEETELIQPPGEGELLSRTGSPPAARVGASPASREACLGAEPMGKSPTIKAGMSRGISNIHFRSYHPEENRRH